MRLESACKAPNLSIIELYNLGLDKYGRSVYSIDSLI